MWSPVVEVAACLLAAGAAACLLSAGAAAEPACLPSQLSLAPWNATAGRIVGGEQADIESHPWQASVMWDGRHLCGASVIGHRWLMTAAHCIDCGSARRYKVRVGTHDLNRGGTVYRVRAVVFHSAYDPLTNDYDAVLLKTRRKIATSGKVQIVSLGTSEPEAGTTATVTGWGYTEANELSDRLLAVTVQIQERSSCNATYKGGITENMICAGVDEGGKDACQGDSGGPLVVDGRQYGIVSWGRGCGLRQYPGVYTSIPALRSWIRDKAGI